MPRLPLWNVSVQAHLITSMNAPGLKRTWNTRRYVTELLLQGDSTHHREIR